MNNSERFTKLGKAEKSGHEWKAKVFSNSWLIGNLSKSVLQSMKCYLHLCEWDCTNIICYDRVLFRWCILYRIVSIRSLAMPFICRGHRESWSQSQLTFGGRGAIEFQKISWNCDVKIILNKHIIAHHRKRNILTRAGQYEQKSYIIWTTDLHDVCPVVFVHAIFLKISA